MAGALRAVMTSRLFMAVVLLSACGPAVELMDVPDAMTQVDAGVAVDAGIVTDAGSMASPDAGDPMDAGVDGGTPTVITKADGGTPLSWRQRVIYLVMPDRFFNGDPSNDRAGTASCFDPQNPRRFHGGDFEGLRQKLPYLQELGVTALWVTPANLQIAQQGQSCGYHGYWADLALPDDGAVEPKLGTSSELHQLVNDSKRANVRFILDLVTNHTGSTARLKTQRPTWFHDSATCAGLGDRTVTCPLNSHLPDLAQEQPDVAQYLDGLSARWVREYGLDGIRMDTAKHVPRSYFRDRWFPAIRAERPDIFTIAEVYLEGGANDLKPYLDSGFDSAFNFPLRRALVNVFARGGSVDELANAVRDDVSTLGLARTLELTSFIDNHDVPRFVSIVSGVSEDEVQKRYTIALTALFTLPGIPQLYAGNEIGQYGGADPDNRRDLPSWAFDAAGRAQRHAMEAVPRPGDVFTRMQRLIALRTTTPALSDGEYSELWRQNGGSNANVFAYGRRAGDSQIIVVINNGGQSVNVDMQAPSWASTTSTYEDVLNDGASALTFAGRRIRLTIPARSSAVYVRR